MAVNGGTLAVNGLSVASPFSGVSTGLLTVGAGGSVTATSVQIGGGGTIVVGAATGAQANLTDSGFFDVGGTSAGTATLIVNQTGSIGDSGGLTVGGMTGGSGTVIVNTGGTIGTGLLSVGGNGIGAMTIQAGAEVTTYSTTNNATVGSGTGGSGTLVVNGGTLLETSPSFQIGGTNVNAQLLVENNGFLSTNLVGFGFGADINGSGTGQAAATITSGGTWLSTGNVFIGDSGFGSLDVNSNGLFNTGTFNVVVGQQSGSSGTLTVENGGTVVAQNLIAANNTASALIDIGAGGRARVNQLTANGGGTIVVGGTSAAAIDVAGNVDIGANDAGSGIAYLSVDAGGTLTIGTVGAPALFNNMLIGQAAGPSGTVAVAGGTIADVLGLTVNKGLLTISQGGIVSLGTTSDLRAGSFGGGGAIGLPAFGIVQVGSGTITGAQDFIVATGLLEVDSGGTVTVSGGLGTGSSVGPFGNGTLIVNGGRLSQTNDSLTIGSGFSSGTVLVKNGGTLTTDDSQAITFSAAPSFAAVGTVVNAIWNANGALYFGSGNDLGIGHTGSLDIDANGLVNAGTNAVTLGQSGGSGTLTAENGGTLLAGQLTVADQTSGSTGLLYIGDAGSVSVSGVTVGGGGTIVVGGTAHAATLTESSGLGIGDSGPASAVLIVNQFGTVTESGAFAFRVGAASGGSGTVVVNGGLLNNSNVLTIGGAGAAGGQFTIEAGGTVVSSHGGGGPAVDIDTASAIQAAATVTGTGSVWKLTAAGQQLIVGDTGSGQLVVTNGGTVDAGNDRIEIGNQNGGSGTVTVGGGNALLKGGILDIATPGAGSATGLLTIGTGGTVMVSAVNVGNGGAIVLAGGLLDPPSTITIAAGGTISGYGTIDGSLVIGGTVIASGGLLDITGSISGGGLLSVANGGALEVDGPVPVNTTIAFNGTAGIATVGSSFAGTIVSFVQGDSLIIAGVTDVTSVSLASPTVLDIQQSAGPDILLNLDAIANYGTAHFSFFTSGNNTVITDDVTPCYLAGTLIRTDRGDVAVEDLAIGDRVVTLDGSAKPIKWIGRRAYSAAFAAGNRDVVPILIKDGALGANTPVRDLYVSPLHAMYLDGVLVQAEHLVNGVSVVRCPDIDPIRYFHIELENHDVIFAEGAPAETFVDCDSRGMFHNAAEFAALYPADASRRWRFCAPRIDSGPALDAIRARIDRRTGLNAAGPGALQGNLDGLDGTTLSGWAFDPSHPTEPVVLDVFDGDGSIARVTANRFRSDLETAGVGDGRFGFELRLSHVFSPHTRHELRVRRVADGRELPGSPLVIEPRDRQTLVREMRQVVDIATAAAGDPRTLDALLDTFQFGIDRIRRLRTAKPGAADVSDRLLRWAPNHRRETKRILIVADTLPRRDRDVHAAPLLSHIAAMRALGWDIEFVASAELARGDDAAAALKAWGVTCHRAPVVASVEEVLRRAGHGYDCIYLHRLGNTEIYAPLARIWQPRARIVSALTASDPAGARTVAAIRSVDTTIVFAPSQARDLGRAAPMADVRCVPWAPHVVAKAPKRRTRAGIGLLGGDGLAWLMDAVVPLVWERDPDMTFVVAAPHRSGDARIRTAANLAAMLGDVRVMAGAGRDVGLLESLGAGIPAVATSGAADAAWIGGRLGCVVADDAQAMADRLCDLYHQAALHGWHARSGLAAVRAHCNETAAASAMAAVLGPVSDRFKSSRAG